MNLVEWTSHYIDYRDAFDQSLQNKSIEKNTIICTFAHKKVTYIVHEEFAIDLCQSHSVLVCLNTKQNVDKVVLHWQQILSIDHLKILFVNMKTNEQWLLNPRAHALVADDIKMSLYALLDSITRA